MYIMCVTLCFFSALSRRVGALQISIIILYYHQELTAGWHQTGVPGQVVVDVAPEAVPAVVRVTAEVVRLLQAIVREVLGPETDTATS